MRISDWSSDVCSSDLHGDALHRTVAELYFGGQGASELHRAHDWLHERADRGVAELLDEIAATVAPRRLVLDRKSVVEGTSVSVGVDLGGRRSIQKNNNT